MLSGRVQGANGTSAQLVQRVLLFNLTFLSTHMCIYIYMCVYVYIYTYISICKFILRRQNS